MDLQLLSHTLNDRGEPPFRARQVWSWAAHGARGYEDMTNLPGTLRHALAQEVPFSSLTLASEARARDGTVKALFHTPDGHPLETVMMSFPAPGGVRRSICLSSQSGCALTCTFCATGAMRFARNLTVSEIVDQALHFRRAAGPAGEPAGNCVFMGMGEPLLNLDAVLGACERLPDVGISHRHTAISTVGWIPGIEALAQQGMPVRLALSVHAADESLRSQLMPVNERYPLRDVIEACRAFYARKRRRIFVEYVMLAGVNDSYAQALQLAQLLAGSGESATAHRPGVARGRRARDEGERAGERGGVFKVNLIPYNPTSTAAGYRCSSPQAMTTFRDVLRERGVDSTIRLVRGRDIAAACGQLAADSRPRSQAEPSA
jgi:23S rRNA (adenine2503-C2)-methyltransferase